MGTIAQKLQKAQQSKEAIKAALIAKGVKNVDDVMSHYAGFIKAIQTGGGSGGGGDLDFSKIGYNTTPSYFLNALDFAESILNKHNVNDNWRRKWADEKDLIIFPLINEFNGNDMFQTFKNSGLAYCPILDTHNVKDMKEAFSSCASLVEIGGFNVTSNVTNMEGLFYNCSSLLYVPSIDSSNVTNLRISFRECRNLRAVYGIDFSKATNIDYIFNASVNLQYLRITNLGAQKNIVKVELKENSLLGDNTPITNHPEIDVSNAKRALIDTLLTDSFDRATAGYPACTITLHQETKNRLIAFGAEDGRDYIAEITAKGYSIA